MSDLDITRQIILKNIKDELTGFTRHEKILILLSLKLDISILITEFNLKTISNEREEKKSI